MKRLFRKKPAHRPNKHKFDKENDLVSVVLIDGECPFSKDDFLWRESLRKCEEPEIDHNIWIKETD